MLQAFLTFCQPHAHASLWNRTQTQGSRLSQLQVHASGTMELQVTPAMQQLLRDAADSTSLPQDVRQAAAACKDSTTVAWASLKLVAAATNAAAPPGTPPVLLHQLCSGSDIILPSKLPKPPNPELETRRAMLRGKLEDMQYADMVADITQKERDADAMRGALPSTQAQLSYGAHVLVMMFTGFAVLYWGTKMWLDWDELWAGLAGALGMTGGMILETTLLILRTNMPRPLEQQYPHLFDKNIWNKKKKPPTTQPPDANDPLAPVPIQPATAKQEASVPAGKGKGDSSKKRR